MSNLISLDASAIVDAQEVEDYDRIRSVQVKTGASSSADYEFWIRSDPDEFAYLAYSALTAYDGEKVIYNGNAYLNIQAGTGNAPSGTTADNAYWEWLWVDATENTGEWPNCYIRCFSDGIATRATVDLYPLTVGDVKGSKIGTVDSTSGAVVKTFSLAPGKYLLETDLYTGIGSADYRLEVRQKDNTISAGMQVRMMKVDFSGLETINTSPITVDKINDGLLSSSSYAGGSW